MSDDQSLKDRENEGPLSGQKDDQEPDQEKSGKGQSQDQGQDLSRDQAGGNDNGGEPVQRSRIDLEKKSQPKQAIPDAGRSTAGDAEKGPSPDQAASPEDSGPEQAGLETGADPGKTSEAEIVSEPEDNANSTPGADAGSGLALAAFAPFLLIFFLAAMFWQDLWQHWQGQGLFWPQEVAGLDALQKSMPAGQWLLQVGPGASSSNPLPGFHWFAGGLAHVLPWLAPGMVCQLAASLATAILLLAVWFLALCSGLGVRSAFAAGIVLLCTPILALSGDLFGPETLACALMLLSLACFSRGWQAGTAWISLPAGFVLAGLAGLTGGLFHLLLPLVASFLLLVWRGTYRRAQGADAIAGFCLMLVLVIGWLALTIIRVAPASGLDALVASQIQLVWPLAAECWWIPAIAATGLLPWLLLPCCVSWWDRLRNAWGSLKASRKERSGVAFLWISLCLAIACSVLASRSGSPYLGSLPLCLVCLAAPLAGSAYVGLSGIGRRAFHCLVALLLLACGLAMLAFSYSISVDVAAGILPEALLGQLRDLVPALGNLPMLGLAFLVAAIGLFFVFVTRQRQGGLLYLVLACIAFYQVGYFLLVPNLVASPNCGLKSLEFHLERQEAKASGPADSEQPDKQDGMTQASQPEAVAPADQGQPDSQDSGPAGNGESRNDPANDAAGKTSSAKTTSDGTAPAELTGQERDQAPEPAVEPAPVPDTAPGEQPGPKSGE